MTHLDETDDLWTGLVAARMDGDRGDEGLPASTTGLHRVSRGVPGTD
jgi:hypothetical protein